MSALAATEPRIALRLLDRWPTAAASLRMELDVLVPEHRLVLVAGHGVSVGPVAAGLAIAEGAAGHASLLVAGLTSPERTPGWSEATPGFAEWLLANGGTIDPIHGTDLERVFVSPSGAGLEPARLRLDVNGVVRFRDEALARFERIVWCVNGIESIGELAVVARVADAVLFVAEPGRTDREIAGRMRRAVADVGARVVGVVAVG